MELNPNVTSQLTVLVDVVLALMLGGAIGFEREKANKQAGLRTHMLVAAAAAFLVAVSNALVTQFSAEQTAVSADPIRIIDAVITGVSFLGAGTIIRLRNGGQVEGLTTAASLLLVAGIGVAIGVKQYVAAIGVTIIVLLVLRGLLLLEARVKPTDDPLDGR